MKKTLKVTSLVIGVTALAGTTAYVLTQTEQGRAFVSRTKKKAQELKDVVCEQLELLQEEYSEKPIVVLHHKDLEESGFGELPETFMTPLILQSELKNKEVRSRIICDRRQAVFGYYNQGIDAETIAELLDLSYAVVLEDLEHGEQNGQIER